MNPSGPNQVLEDSCRAISLHSLGSPGKTVLITAEECSRPPATNSVLSSPVRQEGKSKNGFIPQVPEEAAAYTEGGSPVPNNLIKEMPYRYAQKPVS